MAKIFALQGLKNSGKSSTLVELRKLVHAKYPNCKEQNQNPRRGRDVLVIIDFVDGKKVGIESLGDPGFPLDESLASFRNANCDVMFCACRTRGMTADWVSEMSPPDTVQFITQTATATGQQAINTAKAKHLMQLAGI